MRRRLVILAAASVGLIVSVVALAQGCGGESVSEFTPSTAAPPQRSEVSWVEPFAGEAGDRLVFRVDVFEVLAGGWRAEISVSNETDVPWKVARSSFGVMLFASGELSDLEQRVADRRLPALRAARTFEPALPDRIAAGETWRTVMSASGSLAAGRWVRVVFGDLVADGTPPKGLPPRVTWITDHALKLGGEGATS